MCLSVMQDAHRREAVRLHLLLPLLRRQVQPARAPADAPPDQEVLVPRLQEDLLAHEPPQQGMNQLTKLVNKKFCPCCVIDL